VVGLFYRARAAVGGLGRGIPRPAYRWGEAPGRGVDPGLIPEMFYGRKNHSGTVSITPATDGCHGLFLMPVIAMTDIINQEAVARRPDQAA
jgi:hypothetical protein